MRRFKLGNASFQASNGTRLTWNGPFQARNATFQAGQRALPASPLTFRARSVTKRTGNATRLASQGTFQAGPLALPACSLTGQAWSTPLQPSTFNELAGRQATQLCSPMEQVCRTARQDCRPADAAFGAPKKSSQPPQTEALDALLPALQKHERVSAIMACGTGKRLVALWVAENVAQTIESREATPRKLASHEVAGNAPANSPRPEGTPDFHRPFRTDSVPGGEPDTSCLANIQRPFKTDAGGGAAKILILLPSLALLRQTLPEWLRISRDGEKSPRLSPKLG